MSSGLLALLDDVSALVKAGAASLDDISSQVAKTTSKVSGIVIDDAAVTPKYVVGLNPERELSIIWNITKKSLINKILLLGPITMLLGYFLPWLITPILMLGGSYLCLEGFHKIYDYFFHRKKNTVEDTVHITPKELEKIRTTSAVRTDLILSAEIIAITYSTVLDKSFIEQIVVMLIVGVGITMIVYGSVALIVKADDFGLYLAKEMKNSFLKRFGVTLVKFMPYLLKLLSFIGTFAMLYVGSDIIIHGISSLSAFFESLAAYYRLPLIIIGGLCWGGIIYFCENGIQRLRRNIA